MSYLFSNYARKPFEIVKGAGVWVVDDQGKKYLDFTSGIGVMNLGHHPVAVEKALAQQANQLWHMPNLYHSALQESVAKELANGLDYLTFFCNSGAEANEAAIKLARKATGRSQIVSFTNSFHGRTYGAMSATGQKSIQKDFEPLVPGFSYGTYNDLSQLSQLITTQTAGVMLELIQGEGGVLVADSSWVTALVDRCHEVGALVMVDEVQTGMGRVGSLFAYQQYAFEPDIFTLAKGLGNGIPVGAMLGKAALGTAFNPGSHGTTFGGNKLAMAAAQQVIAIMKEAEFFPEVQRKSQELFTGLKGISSPLIREIRGSGLMVGIELSSPSVLQEVTQQLEAAGLLTLRAGQQVLRLLPALTVTSEEIAQGVALIKKVLTK